MSHTAPIAPTRSSGIVGEIETTGIDPVPEAERVMSPPKIFNVWVMSSATATAPLVANVLYPDGFWYMIGAIVVTWAIFAIPTGILSEMGRELPLTIMVVARRIFGWLGSVGFSALFTLINLVFFGLNCAVGADILASLAHTGPGIWYWIVGGLDILLVLFGMKWLEIFYRYTAVLLVASYAALAIYLATHYTLHLHGQTAPMEWGAAITFIASFSIVGWAYDMSTVSRFAIPSSTSESRGRRRAYFWLPSIGIMLPVLLMGALGMLSQTATGNWNIAVLGGHVSGWGAVAAVGVTIAILHTNAMNLYPSTIDILVIARSVLPKKTRWEQPAVTIVFGILGTVMALAGILNHVETFVDDMGDFIAPFCLVLIADWFWGLRHRDDVASYFVKPRGWRGMWSWPAVTATVIGFVVSFYVPQWLPGWFANDVPTLLVGGLVSLVLYVAYLWLRPLGTTSAGDDLGASEAVEAA